MTDTDALCLHKSDYVGKFKRNFVKNAFCELRFPTVLEFGEQRLPGTIIKALRKSYPTVDTGSEFTVGAGGSSTSTVHIMRSMKGGWAVSFKPSAITLEVQNYPGYAELRRRVVEVIEATSSAIDSDFWTRIGLRFVNVIDRGDPAAGWVNGQLAGPLGAGVFKSVAEYSGRLASLTEDGGFLLQHGLKIEPGQEFPAYVLDVDCFRNSISVDQTVKEMDDMHDQAFNIFEWSLGPVGRAYLLGDE